MRAIFDNLNLLQKRLDTEAALARAEASQRLVPQDATAEISRKARAELSFDHPRTGKRLHFESPLPPGLQNILDKLRQK